MGFVRDVAARLVQLTSGLASGSATHPRPAFSKFEIILGRLVELIGPGVNDGLLIEIVHGSHDPILEFLFGRDADVAEDGAGKFREEALDEVEPGAVLGSEGEFKAVRGLIGEPGFGLFGDVRGMIVEDQLDRCVGRIGGVEKLEEFDEFAAAMAILDQRMDLAGDEVDAGQQADRAVTFIFMLTCEGRMHAGLGRQVGGGRCDGLYAGLLVVGNDRHRVAQLLLRDGCGLLQDSHLAINAQHFGHLLSKVRIALFQVVSHFVRFHLFLVEDLAHCALGEVGEARMSLRGSMLASVAGQKPRCPQFVGIAKFLRLPARQRHQPCLGLGSDRRLSTGASAIIQRSQRAFGHGALDAALDRLMMQPECPAVSYHIELRHF